MKTFIIQNGKTVGVFEGALEVQVTEIERLESAGDAHVKFALTEEGVITDAFDCGEVMGTRSQMWDELWDSLEGA